VDQTPAVAFTVFLDAWPRARETEIGAALCSIDVGKDFDCLLNALVCKVRFFLHTVFAVYAQRHV